MSTTEGSKKVRPKNSPWNETQPQLNGRTVEITPPPAPLRDPSISGSERLRRPRFEQAPYDFAADQGSSRGNLTYEPPTTYAGSLVTDQMSQLQGGDNQADNASIISYNSTRDVTQFIREINGRIFNNLNDSYFLPSDEPEWVRLEKQSVALVLAMGGLYLCPEVTEAILNPADGQPKRILDLGCGTGSWACEMARRFPHASVLGVDLAPPPVDTGGFPPNLRFEIDDINLGLAHFYDQFDLVHARCVSGGINDMDKTIVEFQRCLKPGGFLIIMEGDHMYETRHKLARLKKMRGDPDVSAVSENGSYLRRMIVEVCEAGTLAGSCINRAGELIDWGLWEYPLIDPDTCSSGGFYLPIGPWARAPTTDDTQMLHYAGTLMRQSFLNIHRAYHKVFFQHGMSQDVLNEWSHHIDDELTRQTQKIWVRFQFCWGRRRAADGLPAPPLPPRLARSSPTQSPPSSPQEENASISSDIRDFRRAPGYHYPAIEVFTTPEEARNDRAYRQASKGEMPELMVRKAWRSLQQQRAQQTTD